MITLKSDLAAKTAHQAAVLGGNATRPSPSLTTSPGSAGRRCTTSGRRSAGYRRPTLAIEVITARHALDAAGLGLDGDPELTLRSGTFDPDAEAVLAWCLREAGDQRDLPLRGQALLDFVSPSTPGTVDRGHRRWPRLHRPVRPVRPGERAARHVRAPVRRGRRLALGPAKPRRLSPHRDAGARIPPPQAATATNGPAMTSDHPAQGSAAACPSGCCSPRTR